LIYRFGDAALDTERRELLRKGFVCPVEPQVFDLLEYLLRNRHRVVSRDDVFNAVWQGRIVSDAALSTRINAARRAIGDNGEAQRLIRTLRGRGLRFVGAVSEDKHPSAGPALSANLLSRHSGPFGAVADRPTLVVLPFADGIRDDRLAGFAEAFTDEIHTSLAQSDWISVASGHSSFAAHYVLQGSVRPANHGLRISAQLIDRAIDRCVWAGRYDRDLAGAFAVQRGVVAEIVEAAAAAVYATEVGRAGAQSPAKLNTWQAIVRALSLVNTRDKAHVASARAVLQKAISHDPSSSRAHALLSFVATLDVHMGWVRRGTAIPLALQIAQRATSLNPEDPWAHLAFGYATIYAHPDDAIPRLEKALALNANMAIAHYFIALASTYAGHCTDVAYHAEMAEKLSPVDLLARGNAGCYDNVRATAAYITGHFDQGIEFARKALAESPALVSAYRALVVNSALSGRMEESRSALETLKRLAPNMSQQWLEQTTAVWVRAQDHAKYREGFRIAGLAR
jgi:DNA-binding winged helix-turn-helix (wHTH) protein/TolB-like protein